MQTKSWRSSENLVLTRGQNWRTSSPASSWLSWLNWFGIYVMLYPIPLHIGTVVSWQVHGMCLSKHPETLQTVSRRRNLTTITLEYTLQLLGTKMSIWAAYFWKYQGSSENHIVSPYQYQVSAVRHETADSRWSSASRDRWLGVKQCVTRPLTRREAVRHETADSEWSSASRDWAVGGSSQSTKAEFLFRSPARNTMQWCSMRVLGIGFGIGVWVLDLDLNWVCQIQILKGINRIIRLSEVTLLVKVVHK